VDAGNQVEVSGWLKDATEPPIRFTSGPYRAQAQLAVVIT
jgi:hypothetical protein